LEITELYSVVIICRQSYTGSASEVIAVNEPTTRGDVNRHRATRTNRIPEPPMEIFWFWRRRPAHHHVWWPWREAHLRPNEMIYSKQNIWKTWIYVVISIMPDLSARKEFVW